MNKSNLATRRGKWIPCLVLLLSVVNLIPAAGGVNQGGDDPGAVILGTRPAAKSTGTSRPTKKQSYSGPKKNPFPKPQAEQANNSASAVGVTVWRLRDSAPNDAVEIRDLIHPGGGLPQKDVTPERVAMDTPLMEGEPVRLTIESFRKGYLYVIDRPRYADGKYGDPYLIFPTQRMGLDNLVTAGQTIQIPGPTATPDYFVLERGKSREGELQVSEELVVIVKPEPFESFKTPPADRKLLTKASVEALIEKYKANIEETDRGRDASKFITMIEKLASKDAAIRLSQDDPFPQTLYRLAVKADDPMLVRFELKVRGK